MGDGIKNMDVAAAAIVNVFSELLDKVCRLERKFEALDDINKRLSAIEERLNNTVIPSIGSGESIEQHIANLECNVDDSVSAWHDVIDAGAMLMERVIALEMHTEGKVKEETVNE